MSTVKKNFKTMLFGTIFSQVLPILATPILTRLFSPSEFGFFGTYLSIVVLLTAFNSGKYELSLNQTNSRLEADNLLVGCFLVTLITTVLAYILVAISQVVDITLNSSIGSYIWLVPISAALASTYQALSYWHNREGTFKKISSNLIYQSLINVFSSIVLGIFSIKSGLILSDLSSKLFSSLNLLPSLKNISWKSIKSNLVAHINSPKYLAPSSILNATTKQVPIIVFSAMFLPNVIGFILLSQRLLLVPVGIVSQSLSQVLLNKMSQEYKESGQCRETYIKSLILLVILPLPIFPIIYLYSEQLITVILGDDWKELSTYIKILFPYYYIYFISGTLNVILLAFNRKKVQLITHIFMAISTILCLGLCFYFKLNIIQSLFLYSTTGVVNYTLVLLISFKISRGRLNAA